MKYFIRGIVIIASLVGEIDSFQQSFLPGKSIIASSCINPSSSSTGTENLSTFRSRNYKCAVNGNSKKSSHLKLAPNAAAISSLLNPIGSATVLAFVVLIHECGHFLAARSMGISVKEFSVGVGPKLAGFSREVEDGNEIDFSFRAFPLGGYVQFPENYNSTLLYLKEKEQFEKRQEEREQKLKNDEKKNSGEENGSTTWKPNFINFMNKENQRKKIELNKFEEEKEKKNQKLGWLFSLSMKKSKDIEKKEVSTESNNKIEVDYYDDPNLLQNRPWNERAIVLVGGVVFNILLAFVLYFGELTVGSGLPKPSFQSGALITQAPLSNGPSAGILQKGDLILGLNGRNMFASDSPNAYQSQESISKFIQQIRETKPGETLHLSVLRNGQQSKPTVIDVSPRQSLNGPMSIGVTLSPNYQGQTLTKATSAVDAVEKAADEVSTLTYETARSILSLLGNLVSGQGTPAGQSVSGPIGVLKTGADVVSRNDVSAVIGFVAAISINLAVVNSLPLPALDGGQLVFVLSEALTGKKIDQRKQEAINSVALLFLLALSFGTTVGDLGVLGKAFVSK